MTTQIHPTKHFHLTLEDPTESEESLQERISEAGIKVTKVRAVSAIHDGISITQILAQGEWDQTTGAATCNGNCASEEAKHVAYENLTDEQRHDFHSDLANTMDHHRANAYMPCDGDLEENFERVALSPCHNR